MELFSVTPKVTYGNYTLLNILTKISMIKKHFEKFEVYYPYTIRDGERADTIAHDYYGSSTYAWLIYLANDIKDPYYDWPMTYQQFYSYLKKKYGQVHELKSQISHYAYTGIGGDSEEDIARKNWLMSTSTYDALDAEDKSGWTAVYVYDYELELNEAKRDIRLLSNAYIKQVNRELSIIFNG